ncbi:hypothetical protein QJS10_CPB21g00988 [Acorus calamus]|uniref:DUF4283 domain-containing protein n=1 Tax=Acorus calamus TaxID=4465 RepID=A0AAV9C7Q5_ACOCL|nr:hypothetical protein QJS10_CPB21g00988 [Acorus calamus]
MREGVARFIKCTFDAGAECHDGKKIEILLKGLPLIWHTKTVVKRVVNGFEHLLSFEEIEVGQEKFPLVRAVIWIRSGSSPPSFVRVRMEGWVVKVDILPGDSWIHKSFAEAVKHGNKVRVVQSDKMVDGGCVPAKEGVVPVSSSVSAGLGSSRPSKRKATPGLVCMEGNLVSHMVASTEPVKEMEQWNADAAAGNSEARHAILGSPAHYSYNQTSYSPSLSRSPSGCVPHRLKSIIIARIEMACSSSEGSCSSEGTLFSMGGFCLKEGSASVCNGLGDLPLESGCERSTGLALLSPMQPDMVQVPNEPYQGSPGCGKVSIVGVLFKDGGKRGRMKSFLAYDGEVQMMEGLEEVVPASLV